VKAACGPKVSWNRLPITDLDTLLLLLRQRLIGDVILSDTRCQQPSCGARVDISFRIGEYLASHRQRRPQWVEEDADGWYRLAGQATKFRLPTGGDLEALDGDADAERELIRKCVQPEDVSAPERRRIERAMEAMAPALSHTVEGACPECGATLEVYFDVRSFVLGELADRAGSIYQDVHLLALHYNWPEESILALPQKRRRYYAEMLRDRGAA